jgi:hypothetical protein
MAAEDKSIKLLSNLLTSDRGKAEVRSRLPGRPVVTASGVFRVCPMYVDMVAWIV